MNPVMICNKATEPHRKTSVGGHQCLACHAELVVTPTGVEAIQHRPYDMYCMQCGLKVAEDYAAKGELRAIGLSPEAIDSLHKKMGLKTPPSGDGPTTDWAEAFGIDVPEGAVCEIVGGEQKDKVIAVARELVPILRDKTKGPKEAAMVVALLRKYVEMQGGGTVVAIAAIPGADKGDMN